jgi:hypothetical protein
VWEGPGGAQSGCGFPSSISLRNRAQSRAKWRSCRSASITESLLQRFPAGTGPPTPQQRRNLPYRPRRRSGQHGRVLGLSATRLPARAGPGKGPRPGWTGRVQIRSARAALSSSVYESGPAPGRPDSHDSAFSGVRDCCTRVADSDARGAHGPWSGQGLPSESLRLPAPAHRDFKKVRCRPATLLARARGPAGPPRRAHRSPVTAH